MAQTLEQQIRKVIKQHYGEDLSMFREDVNYRNATRSFVADIARSLRGQIIHSDDFTDEVAKYNKGGSAERSVGKAIKNLRLKRNVTREQLASKVGFRVDFLAALEDGRFAAGVNLYVDAYYALKPTKQEIEVFGRSIGHCRTREALIQDVIETYYGLNLWTFKPSLSYEEAIKPFVRALSALNIRN